MGSVVNCNLDILDWRYLAIPAYLERSRRNDFAWFNFSGGVGIEATTTGKVGRLTGSSYDCFLFSTPQADCREQLPAVLFLRDTNPTARKELSLILRHFLPLTHLKAYKFEWNPHRSSPVGEYQSRGRGQVHLSQTRPLTRSTRPPPITAVTFLCAIRSLSFSWEQSRTPQLCLIPYRAPN